MSLLKQNLNIIMLQLMEIPIQSNYLKDKRAMHQEKEPSKVGKKVG